MLQNGLLLHGNKSDEDFIDLSFPIMQFLGREMDLSPYFFGVEQYNTDELRRRGESNVKFLKMILLHFRTPRPSEWDTEDAFKWERMVGSYFRKCVKLNICRLFC